MRIFTRLILPLFLFTISGNVSIFSQLNEGTEKKIIQLRSDFQKLSDSPEKVNTLLSLAEIYENTDLDSSMVMNEKAYNLSKKINYHQGIIHYARNQSYLYNLKGQFAKGIEIIKIGYDAAVASGDLSSEASMTANLGISYSYMGEFNNAVSQFHKALDISDAIGDRLRKAKILSVLAGTYNNMAKSVLQDSSFLIKSIEYAKQSLDIARALKDSILICDNLVNIANTLNNLEDMESARPYAEEGNKCAQQLGLTVQYTQSLSVMAKLARYDNKLPLAIRYGEESVTLQKQMGSELALINSLKELALTYAAAGMHEKALSAISEAEEIANKNEINYVLDGIFINKAKYLYTLENYRNAYDYLLKGYTISDSLRGIEIKNQINVLETQYEKVQKEQEILKLNTKQKLNRWIISGLILAFIVMSISGYIWYKNTTYKTQIIEKEKEKLLKEKQLKATESIIKGQEEERHRLAKDLHDGLGGMLSGLKYTLNNMGDNMILTGKSVDTFSNALNMLDQAIIEMRKVAHNMMPESLHKFGLDETLKDFISKMNASGSMKIHYQAYNYQRLDQTLEVNIYRIIQEIINNAMKYAKATDMYIQMDCQNENLHLTVEDNGIGFDTNDEKNVKGIGLKNIADRVSYMNGKLEISSTPGKGTLFVIEINNKI